MDPDAVLLRIRQNLRAYDKEGATEAFDDLFEWMRKGGFAPKVHSNSYVSVGDDGRAYLLIRGPAGLATLTKFEYNAGLEKMVVVWEKTFKAD